MAKWQGYLAKYTSTRHDRIKASSSRYPKPLDHLVLLRRKESGWLLFRSWLVCTMTTERSPKERKAESTIQESVEVCQDVIVVCEVPLGDLWLGIRIASLSACCKEAPVFLARWRLPLWSSEMNTFPFSLNRVCAKEK
jgi:hypothetical protein